MKYYYTVEYQTQPGEGYYDEFEGRKSINVYYIENNQLKHLIDLHVDNNKSSEEEISFHLDHVLNVNYDYELEKI